VPTWWPQSYPHAWCPRHRNASWARRAGPHHGVRERSAPSVVVTSCRSGAYEQGVRRPGADPCQDMARTEREVRVVRQARRRSVGASRARLPLPARDSPRAVRGGCATRASLPSGGGRLRLPDTARGCPRRPASRERRRDRRSAWRRSVSAARRGLRPRARSAAGRAGKLRYPVSPWRVCIYAPGSVLPCYTLVGPGGGPGGPGLHPAAIRLTARAVQRGERWISASPRISTNKREGGFSE
jgi:hypothetical protein